MDPISNIKEPVKVLMVAINGYGHYYLKTLLEEVGPDRAVLSGVIDPEAEKSEYINLIKEKGIPVFNTIQEYYNSSFNADLTVISSPPQYHVEQAMVALKSGSNVLVDKPVGVGEKSVMELIRISEECQRWVEVGYQWSFSSAIQTLKRDMMRGLYGKAKRFKAICLWPRDFSYYNRNSWAGRIEDDDNNLILDSPANNACAHFLHNLLYLSGDEMHKSDFPARLNCETYRANDIESFDTISIDLMTERGIELLFYASHATEYSREPEFILEFTEGIVKYENQNDGIIGISTEGIMKYGAPDGDNQFKKLFKAIKMSGRKGSQVCPPEAAIAHTMCIDMIHSPGRTINDFAPDQILDSGKRRWVKNLNGIFNKAYEKGDMLSNYKLSRNP